jgi:hypothetical protein
MSLSKSAKDLHNLRSALKEELSMGLFSRTEDAAKGTIETECKNIELLTTIPASMSCNLM